MSIKIGHQELGRFIGDVLAAYGASQQDAAAVAQGLVWANLRGVDGHGVSRLPRYLRLIEHGMEREISGKVALDFQPQGLVCAWDMKLG